MGKVKEKLSALWLGLGESVKRFPLEITLGLVYFILFVLVDTDVLKVSSEAVLFWFFPHIVLLFTLHRLSEGRGLLLRGLYYLSWFFWIPLALFKDFPLDTYALVAWLLALILLCIGDRRFDNVSLGKHILGVAWKMMQGVFIGLLLMGAYSAICGSVNFLFGLKLPEEWFLYPNLFVSYVVMPLLCCHFLSEKSSEGTLPSAASRFLEIVLEYVMAPSLAIYLVILYGYIARILVHWQLPDGGVAYMVLTFLCVGLLCELFRLQVPHKNFDGFYRWFPALSVPPLILLWVGAWRRIGDYGLTEDRVWLLVACALLTLFIFLCWKERTRRFQRMAIILSAALIFFTYIPGVRAKDFGIRSQQARLDKLLPEILEDGRIPETFDYEALAQDSLRCQKIISAQESWSYLHENMPEARFKARYGALGDDFHLERWRIRDAEYVEWRLQGPVNLEGYPLMLPNSCYSSYEDDQNVVFYADDSKTDTLICCPVKERLDAENPTAESVLVYRNGRYAVVFGWITDWGKDAVNRFGTGAVRVFSNELPARPDTE